MFCDLYDTTITILNNGHVKISKFQNIKRNTTPLTEERAFQRQLREPYIEDYDPDLEILNPERYKRREERKKKRALDTESRKLSALRAFRNVKIRSEHNYKKFNSMITLTFADSRCDFDICDVTECNKRLNSYLTYLRENNDNLYYIGVPEYQERGAVHYHILTSLKIDSQSIPKRQLKVTKSKGKYKTLIYYDLPGWSFGWSDAEPINSTAKALRYITKYINKETTNKVLPFGAHRFYCSQNLERPVVIKVLSDGNEFSFFNCFTASKTYHSTNEKWLIDVYNMFFSPELVDNGCLSLDIIKKYYKDKGLYCCSSRL